MIAHRESSRAGRSPDQDGGLDLANDVLESLRLPLPILPDETSQTFSNILHVRGDEPLLVNEPESRRSVLLGNRVVCEGDSLSKLSSNPETLEERNLIVSGRFQWRNMEITHSRSSTEDDDSLISDLGRRGRLVDCFADVTL